MEQRDKRLRFLLFSYCAVRCTHISQLGRLWEEQWGALLTFGLLVQKAIEKKVKAHFDQISQAYLWFIWRRIWPSNKKLCAWKTALVYARNARLVLHQLFYCQAYRILQTTQTRAVGGLHIPKATCQNFIYQERFQRAIKIPSLFIIISYGWVAFFACFLLCEPSRHWQKPIWGSTIFNSIPLAYYFSQCERDFNTKWTIVVNSKQKKIWVLKSL